MSRPPDSVELAVRVRSGDATAADEIDDRYRQRLATFAQSRLSNRLNQRVDADDIVQSTLLSFFNRCLSGEFVIDHSGALWKLLTTIAQHKVAQQVEKHHAAKRSVRRESLADEVAVAHAAQTDVQEIALLKDELDWLATRLDPLQQRTIELRLGGWDTASIATELGPTERTIRRWLAFAERLLASRLSGAPGATSHRRISSPLDGGKDPAWFDYRDLLLERQIGRGGVCRVYRAFQRSTGQRVAVKTLLSESIANAVLLEAFLREASIVSRFCHPSIVPLLGVGRLPSKSPFLVLQHIDGQDLARLLSATGPMPLPRAATIVIAVAEALHYAHQQGVVHGDVKPANILVTNDSRVFLTDFGFASLFQRSDSPSLLGGTPGYIAPEVLEPSQGKPGPAADVYALGGLLWNLLTGEPPSDSGRMPDVAATNGAIHALIQSCRANEPLDRPASAAAVAREVRRITLLGQPSREGR
jgi:RNA polymerase sigma factor (sigma-70 family)